MSRSRRAILLASLGILTLAAIEIGARGIEWIRDAWFRDPQPFVDAQNPVPVFELDLAGGRARYQRTEHHPLVLRDVTFEATRSPQSLRIFLLGGSAAGGWPFDFSGNSIADQLTRKLERLYPDHTIEVINAAGGTYASHRVRFVFEEVIQYDPDVIVIYSGNNEFLENFVFRPQLPPGPLAHLATARIVHRALQRGARPSFDVESYDLADQTANRLAYAFGRTSRYRRDPEQLQAVLDHFRFNLGWMIRESQARDIPVLLVDVPVDLKDWRPNASRHRPGFGPKDRADWLEAYRLGVEALERGDPEAARAAFARALEIDDEHAEAHFLHGRALLAQNRPEEAREAFIAALERDAYPFRALPVMNEMIHELAASHEVPLVELRARLEAGTRDGILGRETLVDYVHLSEASQQVAADAILDSLSRAGLLPEGPDPDVAVRRIPLVDSGDPLATVRETEALFRQFLIMRQYDELEARRQDYVLALTRAREIHPQMADTLDPRLQLAQIVKDVAGPYQALLRAERLGRLEQEFSAQEDRKIYADYVNLIRLLEAREMPIEDFRELVTTIRYRKQRGTPAP